MASKESLKREGKKLTKEKTCCSGEQRKMRLLEPKTKQI